MLCYVSIRSTSYVTLFYTIIKFLNNLSHSDGIHIKFHFHRCVLHDEIIKLYLTCIYFQKIKLTHHCFKSSPFICNSWIDHMDFLYFLAQPDSRHTNWCHLPAFPSPVPSLFKSTSPRRCAVSRFPSMEPRRTRYLWFIFWQCFVSSHSPSSRNRSIESAPLPLTTLPEPLDYHPLLL
jgi:hypothetical protein